MMTVLFDLVFSVFALISIPKFLVRLKQSDQPQQLFRQRFGFLPKGLQEKYGFQKTLWLHAVSVGEVMAARALITKFLDAYSDWHLALSVTTPTGFRVAQNLRRERLVIFYAPFDLSFSVRRVLSQVKPSIIVLMETEIWPNLIREAKSRRIPIGIVNGRISPRAFKRYRMIKWLVKPVLSCLSFCLAQSERDRNHFNQLGMAGEKVVVTGNMKFDSVTTPREEHLSHPALCRLRESGGLVFAAGSTHWNEEEILLRVITRLRSDFPDLRLVIAPRHPERMDKVRKATGRSGLRFEVFSNRKADSDFDVLLIDQMGVLAAVYSVSDVVFMGGSLIPHGGQNPIEPAFLSKPIVHGPHIFNFHEVYAMLDRDGAGTQVDDEETLYVRMKTLLRNEVVRRDMGAKARAAVRALQGATGRNMDYLSGWLMTSNDQEQTQVTSRTGADL